MQIQQELLREHGCYHLPAQPSVILTIVKALNLIIFAALSFAGQRHSLAGSATWAINPINGDWNTAANWVPQTVPNMSSDTATFVTSNQTQISVRSIIQVGAINFNLGADSFTIMAATYPLTLSGSGVINNSGKVQKFLCESEDGFNGVFFFKNSATAGDMTTFKGSDSSNFIFYDTSSAGSAVFEFGGRTLQSDMTFWDSSSAANATITATLAVISFFDASTAADAHITVSGASFVSFDEDAHGGHVIATCVGGNQAYPSDIAFQNNATAV